MDRQIRGIQREEEKVKRSLKQAAAKNDRDTCLILAKEIVRARKAINRIYTSKAHLNSVQLQMKNQLGGSCFGLVLKFINFSAVSFAKTLEVLSLYPEGVSRPC